jgi:hypothetical protein
VAVIDLLREREIPTLRSSYEARLLEEGGHDFNLRAQRHLAWVLGQLEPRLPIGRKRARWSWLQTLPERIERPGLTAVHGHPEHPLEGHVPYMGTNPSELARCFAAFPDGLLLTGFPSVGYVLAPDGEPYSPQRDGDRYERGEGKLIVNPGAVGLGRHEDRRAVYALVSDDAIEWRRLDYDLEQTRAKLLALPDDLGRVTAARLHEGI